MTSHKSIMAWGDYGPESVTGRWSANTYDADDAVEYVLKSDFEKVRFAADLGLKMAEVNDLWNTAETIKAALTQTTDKEPAQPDPVGWVCAIEQAVAVADAKRQKYATAAHEKPDPWAQNAAKSLCADDISAAIRALITQPQHDALQAAIDAARKVKPLDWSDAEYPNECWNAGDYDIWSEHGGFQVYHWSIKTGDLHHDLKAAQDAAFTHHETRVQSFLAQIGAKP